MSDHVPEGYALTCCPYCQTSGITRRPDPRPELNAIMCESCGEWVTWDDEAGELGKPTPGHLAALAEDPEARAVRQRWVEHRAQIRVTGTDHIENLFAVFWREGFMGEVPPATSDDGFQMRLAFYSGILSMTDMLGDDRMRPEEKGRLLMRTRAELASWFDYADKRPPSDETN